MTIQLVLGLVGIAVTVMVVVAMVLVVPSNTEPAYHPDEHPDGTDHGSPAQGTAITAGGQGLRG